MLNLAPSAISVWCLCRWISKTSTVSWRRIRTPCLASQFGIAVFDTHDLGSLVTRTTVLVGHDVTHQLRVLQHLIFGLHKSVMGSLNTMKNASQAFPSMVQYSFRAILEELHCPYKNIYSADNDAHFTSAVSIFISVNELHKQSGRRRKDKQRRIITTVRHLVPSTRPPTLVVE